MIGNIYELTAKTISYPSDKHFLKAEELANELGKLDDGFVELLKPYVDYLTTNDLGTIEEAYTNTFDVQAVCPLEIGYTLFGEDYKRGEFLVRMSDLHQEHQTPINNSELSDFLPNVLMLLNRMPDDEFKKEFIEKIVMPALTKMLKNFDEKKGLNPFSLPIRALTDLLARHYTMNPTILEVRYE